MRQPGIRQVRAARNRKPPLKFGEIRGLCSGVVLSLGGVEPCSRHQKFGAAIDAVDLTDEGIGLGRPLAARYCWLCCCLTNLSQGRDIGRNLGPVLLVQARLNGEARKLILRDDVVCVRQD